MENCPPGAMLPEFHPLPSDVEVCVMESVFVQVTVVPAATSSWSGLNARFPKVNAPLGMVMGVDDPVVTGTGVGDGDGVE
jgi:hypothetical protein